jgi:hypothetical protein
VCPTKFTFVKIMSREILRISHIFPQGLSPFKILRRFKFQSVPKFIT